MLDTSTLFAQVCADQFRHGRTYHCLCIGLAHNGTMHSNTGCGFALSSSHRHGVATCTFDQALLPIMAGTLEFSVRVPHALHMCVLAD